MDKPWLGSANMPSGHLLVTPCDPGNCHIYFGVQLRALPTALSIARAADRTLVLPPFEYYSGQAQEFANAFKARPAGKSPMFVPFSELYDIERLRQGGAHVVDYHEAGLQQLDVAFLSTAKGTDGKKSLAVNVPSPLDGIIEEAACRGGRDGLQSNITFAGDPSSPVSVRELYGQPLNLGSMRCGVIGLSDVNNMKALVKWMGSERTAAVFNVGHQMHSRVDGMAYGKENALLEASLRPNKLLDQEARDFIARTIFKRSSSDGGWRDASTVGNQEIRTKFVAVHWRHGDYVAYQLLTPVDQLSKRIKKAMATISTACDMERPGFDPIDCPPVFLMTNCLIEKELKELNDALPSGFIRYEPSSPEFDHDGKTLVIEQAIASLATTFVPSQRSAVSEHIEMLRRGRKKDDSKPKLSAEELKAKLLKGEL